MIATLTVVLPALPQGSLSELLFTTLRLNERLDAWVNTLSPEPHYHTTLTYMSFQPNVAMKRHTGVLALGADNNWSESSQPCLVVVFWHVPQHHLQWAGARAVPTAPSHLCPVPSTGSGPPAAAPYAAQAHRHHVSVRNGEKHGVKWILQLRAHTRAEVHRSARPCCSFLGWGLTVLKQSEGDADAFLSRWKYIYFCHAPVVIFLPCETKL